MPSSLLRRLPALLAAQALSVLTCMAAESPPSPASPVTERIQVGGRPLTLKKPSEPAPGQPWLWVGEFVGHLAKFEDALVARGWTVAYVAYPNQFGSTAAMAVWDQVYDELHGKRGLAAKPALLGISRGGMYVTAWARRHPDRLSMVLLDNAVCDARSWPGGLQLQSKGKGSPKDWQLYQKAFGFASPAEAEAKAIRPTDGLEPVVQAGVFLVSVHGTADQAVPFVDNAWVLVDFWQKKGGRTRVFAKEGGDHHPHGLPDPTPLIELLVTGTL